MPTRSLYTFFAFFFAVVTLSACNAADEAMRLPVHAEKLVVMNGENPVVEFDIEIAETESQRAAGLMFRTDLPADRGMLFVFPEESERYFWMRNTPTPLDIIYARRDGEIVRIAADTVPFSETPIPSLQKAAYAFEVHAGTAKRLGIVAGHRLVHPVIGTVSAQ